MQVSRAGLGQTLRPDSTQPGQGVPEDRVAVHVVLLGRAVDDASKTLGVGFGGQFLGVIEAQRLQDRERLAEPP